MKACLVAIALCLPGCSEFFSTAHTVTGVADDVLTKVETAYNVVCQFSPDCGPVVNAVIALKTAPVEQSFIAASRVLETLKLTYLISCSTPSVELVTPCGKAKAVLNEAVVAFNTANEAVGQ